jgi:hypothetical protein
MNMKYQKRPYTKVLLNYPDHGNVPLQKKNPMAEPGIEPGPHEQ